MPALTGGYFEVLRHGSCFIDLQIHAAQQLRIAALFANSSVETIAFAHLDPSLGLGVFQVPLQHRVVAVVVLDMHGAFSGGQVGI